MIVPSPGEDPQTQDNVAASQQERPFHKRKDEDDQEKKPAAMKVDHDKKKPARNAKIRYYAIRKCDSLKAPAIFLSWEDCQFYVQAKENEETPEYEEFESLQGANKYILSTMNNPNPNPSTPSASSTSTKKRSAQAASLDSASTPNKKKAPNRAAVHHVPKTPQETQQKIKKAPNIAHAASLPASTTPSAATVAPTSFIPYATTPTNYFHQNYFNPAPTTFIPYVTTPTNYFNPALHVQKIPKNQTQSLPFCADSWYAMVHLLQKYKDKHGHCDVPWKNHDHVVDQELEPLCNWVKKTRVQVKKFQTNPDTTFLTHQHVQPLLDMGFVVDLKGRRFRPCKVKGGVGTTTTSEEQVDQEGNKVIVQVVVHTKRTQAFEETFDAMIAKLQEYKAIYGHCDVPAQSKKLDAKFVPLGNWVHRMREKMKLLEDPLNKKTVWHLTLAHIKRLTDIGFNKTATERKGTQSTTIQEEEKEFEENLDLLQKTLKEKKAIKDVLNLQYWIGKQRVEYEKFNGGKPSRMTAERLVRLAGAGFTFKAKVKMLWEDRATQWREYLAKHGTDPKRNSQDGLGKWCTDQRVKYHKFKKGEPSNMTQEKIQKLTDWGFRWEYKLKKPENPEQVRPWKHRYGQLVEFKEKHGHCLVPQHFPTLGNWVHTQRMDYRKFVKGNKSAMSKERLNKLNEIGFVFYTGKGGGKRTSESVYQRINNPNTKAKKPAEESESSDEEEEDEDVQERTQAHHLHRGNPQQVAQSPLVRQHAFSPWDRYHLGGHH
jgi:hypothetical protein